jgi:hypothetical protein
MIHAQAEQTDRSRLDRGAPRYFRMPPTLILAHRFPPQALFRYHSTAFIVGMPAISRSFPR